MADPTTFEEALRAALRPEVKSFIAAMGPFRNHKVASAADAAAVVAAIDLLPVDSTGKESIIGPTQQVVGLFDAATTAEALQVLRDDGLPRLFRFYDHRALSPERGADALLAVLQVFARYGTESALDRLAAAIARPPAPDSFFWTGVFKSVRPEAAVALIDRMRQSPPPAATFVAVCAMDFTTARRVHGCDERHLFDTDDGLRQLEAWVLDAEHASYGISAAATLAFITHPHRDRVLALALDHADPGVQLEAAWAAAKLGRRGGVDLLARLATDPVTAKRAVRYLGELGRSDAVPVAASEPDAVALADMTEWLASPFEFGRPPDLINLYDHRWLTWPPTNDRRPVWLFRYTLRGTDGKPDVVGIGMVGSVTFALFGEVTADLLPEDAYALHCCWELERRHDPRSPAKRSVEAGRALLGDL